MENPTEFRTMFVTESHANCVREIVELTHPNYVYSIYPETDGWTLLIIHSHKTNKLIRELVGIASEIFFQNMLSYIQETSNK